MFRFLFARPSSILQITEEIKRVAIYFNALQHMRSRFALVNVGILAVAP